MPAARYSKRHLSPDGRWRVCRAGKQACKFEHHRAGSEFAYLRAPATSHAPKRHDSAALTFALKGENIANWYEVDAVLDADGEEVADELRVAPEGYSGKWCTACGAYLTLAAAAEVDEQDRLDCPNCEEELRLNSLPTDLRADQLRFTSAAAVRKAHWFHVSERENWDGATKAAGVVTHLGSREAALERMAQLVLQGAAGKQFYLHEVTLSSKTRVKAGIWHDQVHWPEEVGSFGNDGTGRGELGVGEGQVQRYMNQYEGPGTVSLLADPGTYTLITSAPIPAR